MGAEKVWETVGITLVTQNDMGEGPSGGEARSVSWRREAWSQPGKPDKAWPDLHEETAPSVGTTPQSQRRPLRPRLSSVHIKWRPHGPMGPDGDTCGPSRQMALPSPGPCKVTVIQHVSTSAPTG